MQLDIWKHYIHFTLKYINFNYIISVIIIIKNYATLYFLHKGSLYIMCGSFPLASYETQSLIFASKQDVILDRALFQMD